MFTQKLNELFSKLGNHSIMCLATSFNDKVTARSMSIIIYNNKFYFQTDTNFQKFEQIKNNHNVALCCNNIQIEGVCTALGHPLLDSNSFFSDLYKKYYESSFLKYSSLKDEILFEVIPSKISVWDYDDGKPYQEFFVIQDNTYQKVYYTI